MPSPLMIRLGSNCTKKFVDRCSINFNLTRSLSDIVKAIDPNPDAPTSNDVNPDSIIHQEVAFSFIEVANGNKKVDVRGKVGRSLLHIAINHGVDLDSACGGVLVCSTCHVITESDIFNILPPQEEDETDMLDLAAGVTAT